MRKIPDSLLWDAIGQAAVPVKSPSDFSAEIWEAVAHLKAATAEKHGVKEAWQRLRSIVDRQMDDGNSGVLDELAKAQSRAEVETARRWTIKQDAREPVNMTQGRLKNIPREPALLEMLWAIVRLQRDMERAPTRREILDAVGKSRIGGYDETSLSKHLTRLGWNDLLS